METESWFWFPSAEVADEGVTRITPIVFCCIFSLPGCNDVEIEKSYML